VRERLATIKDTSEKYDNRLAIESYSKVVSSVELRH